MKPLFDPSPEHVALRDLTRRFAQDAVLPQARDADAQERFNAALFRQTGTLGLLGVLGPEEAGGSALDARAVVIVMEELAWADPGFALSVLSHAVLYVGALRHAAGAGHMAALQAACRGDALGALAMSEPEAGTDVMAMRGIAEPVNGGYVLDGTKMWITNGAPTPDTLADSVLVYLRTSDHPMRGLSLFRLQKDDPGFALSRAITGKLGMRAASCGELRISQCRVPRDRLVGTEGAGFMHIMKTLEIERIALAAIGTGIGLRALEIMNAYASDRRIEGKPLRAYGQIQRHLAETYAEVSAARALLYAVAASHEGASPTAGPGADAAKLMAASAAEAAANRAIQVLGGNGYIADYAVERLWRDARLLSIGGGTNEALQKNITRTLFRHQGRLT